MKKLVTALLLFTSMGATNAIVLRQSPTLIRLLEHMGMYKLTTPKFHAGNLLHHSLWTCRSLGQWFDEKKIWVEGLEQHKLIIMLGGLFHDIGKAGDGNYFYDQKPTHPCNGFALLSLKKNFFLEDGSTLNLRNIYRELEITPAEQRFLAILVAIHWEFGLIMKNVNSNPHTTLDRECHDYLNKLRSICKQAGFNNGTPTKQLIHAAVAVSAADVRGIQPNPYRNDTLMTLLSRFFIDGFQLPCYTGFDAYQVFQLEKEGLPIRDKLCSLL
jgi:hypothetical protein